ncbi:MAG: hypothetical protein WDM71_06755 [Ferruginibacter sp.]
MKILSLIPLLFTNLIINAQQFVQQAKLVGTGNIGAAYQGQSVSISSDGNTAIVGGYDDNNSQGAVWIYTNSGGVWTQQTKLVGTGNIGIGGALQGYSVSISSDGNTAIVGGWYDNSGQGAAWIFTRSGGVWIQQAKLVGTGAIGSDIYQGQSVSISSDGNTAIVGGKADNGGQGAAWIYTRSGEVWTQQSKLVGTGNIGGADQGSSVSISSDGNTAIVGGYTDNGGQGAVWIFTRSGGVWIQQAKLVGTGAIGSYIYQGSSVSISSDGNTAIVGGLGDNNSQGAVWIFSQSGGVWTQQTKLVGTGAIGSYNIYQGSSVSLSSDGNTAIVGGYGDNNDQGAVWVFIQSGGVWTQQTKLVGTDNIGAANQGISVSLSSNGNTAIIGGYVDNSAQGAAWIFGVVQPPTIISFTPTIAATGTTVTIKGTHFTGATSISFGDTTASSFTVVNDSTITAIVGNGASDSVRVIANGDTTSLTGFTYCIAVTPSLSIVSNASGTICANTKVTFTATPTNGGTTPAYLWLKNGINAGTNSITYTDSLLNNNDSVWCVLTSNATCATVATATSNKITIAVNAVPNITLNNTGGASCLGTASLNVGGTNSDTSILWYNGNSLVYNSPLVPVTSGVIIAGDNGEGSAANQLDNPAGIYLDNNGNVYVADFANNRIQKFPAGSTSSTNGITVAGGNGAGNGAKQFNFPSGIYIDASGNMYVADLHNYRIQKFPAGSTSSTNGVTVAGGNGAGTSAKQLNNPSSLYVDNAGNIFVTDELNNRVQKFPAGSTSSTNGVTVAGGNGAGAGANQLNDPDGIYVDGSGYIYVSDYSNSRVQKFPPSSTSSTAGITVAGGNGYGSAANQFTYPSGLYLDNSGNIYVTDLYNYRVQKFPSGSTSSTNGISVVASNGFVPSQVFDDVYVDSGGNIYVSDVQNHLIQKWAASSLDSIYEPTNAGSYTVAVTNTVGCSITSNTIIVTDTLYSFTGSGNWSVASNWANNEVPPSPLPSCAQIIINPAGTSDCILDVPQIISAGSKITVIEGKKFVIPGDLKLQ